MAQLSGAYTINSAQPTSGTNYASFTAAANALNTSGVSGPVTFTVSGGPYTEQITLNQFAGSSATNRVTFNGGGSIIQFGSGTSAQRAVITLNGADFVTLSNLAVDATVGGTSTATYGWGVQVLNDADNVTINNCTITSSTSSTSSTNFVGIVANNSATSLTTGGNAGSNLTVQNNTIQGGYYGIKVVGNATNILDGYLIQGNTVQNFYLYGIDADYTSSLQVIGNDISRPTRTTVSTFYGISLGAGTSGAAVEKNRIHRPFGGASASTAATYGIYLTTSTAATVANSPNFIINNLVYNLDGSGTVYGLYNGASGSARYYHNTVSIDNQTTTGTSTAYGFYHTTGLAAEFRNNVVQVTRSGSGTNFALYFSSATGNGIVSNNNDLVVGGTDAQTGYYVGTEYATLTTWKTANNSAYDQNSVDADPQFVNVATGNLQPTASPLNNTATPLARVTQDITGAPRGTTPDIGAYEFSPVADDVAVVSIDSPTAPVLAGARPVTVTVLNNGGSVLNTVRLAYVLNGGTPVAQTFTLTGGLASGTSRALTFTTPANLVTGANTLTVTGSLPNGNPDTNASNNTQTVTLYTSLTGIYTINSAQPTSGTNFASFTDAATALNQSGVAAAVTFNVSGGPYTEQFSLSPISGASATNRVTFNGNGSTIRFGSSNTNQRAVVTLNGADYVTLDSLTIDATNAGSPGTYGWGLFITNQADNNIVRNCTITTSEASTSSFFAGVVVSGSATSATSGGNAANNLLLEGNTINGGYYGLTLMGTSTTTRSTGNIVRNNTIGNFYFYGVYAAYQADAQYVGNDISRLTRSGVSTFYGLYVYYNLGATVVGNRIHDPFTGTSASTSTMYGLYIYYSDGTAASPILVANNLIYNVNGGNITYGIYNYYSDYVDYYHNSVSLDDTSTGTAIRAYSQYAASNITLRNNIFSVTRPSSTAAYAVYVYYTAAAPPTMTSNYNDLYVGTGTNAYVGYYGTATTATSGGAATLTAWQVLNNSAFDQNSVSVDPRFRSSSDLRPSAANLNNTGTPTTLTRVPLDFAGVTRNNPPDIGAYEFSPSANDVELLSIDSPVTPATPGTNPVTVTIRNNGTVTLTSVTLSYALNGGTPQQQVFTALTLASGATQQLTFTQGVVAPSGPNTIVVTASLPNGGTDSDPSNNTKTATFNQPTPNNDEPCTAIALGTGSITGSNSGSSTSVQPGLLTAPSCSPASAPRDVWFTFTAASASRTLYLAGNPAGMVRVFSSPSCSAGPFTQVFCQGSNLSNTSVGTVNITGLTSGQLYYVAVSGYGSNDFTGAFTISTTPLSTRSSSNSAALSVFPNPSATGQLTLRLTELKGAGTVELVNALGQRVLAQPLAATGEQQLSTRGLATGLYTLRVQVAGQVLTRKVVLQ
ncbi:right-handed parallel beta-helix repeat-containing protein [Hymenobacter sp. BT186]|uniref:Right-handed parallel beta-helix repeat-containing protein n=1 Tax=Hymenobacter telluris TaxID=2816474 RepID=A0A939ESQ4_9BACT|nr:right-handed parallel beta-helix repeat-containing protein [Hymenobacter telluris]MBO0356419.1 right-handed parallel beta-helix repeat-containing protein [Hymenobacter telluris]MBW3372443.1 right-handed parallel beta-helix repeat-containing protein [Hymenobacter norwichensis]